ncbi:unnamed protein product [Acanthoscelides obtectus]|uniref:Uncharacterized protein n=1 Tax=Acanthoscelides obtectus TaxID=200917 RepID=A0A9P0PBQ6_ACAOB|nr:unnamed protein product [Acanthoscelides obtectus]CAK1648209.1 Isoaspartyl peptidase/L-asparaginase [Acanthoscelides obtectus]
MCIESIVLMLLACTVGMSTSVMKTEPILLVHGGAGDIPDERVPTKMAGMRKSVLVGFQVLKAGGSAIDAVEAAIKVMEDDEAFNAGYGSVLNTDGEVEMDACVMLGNLSAGAVSIVRDIQHPISLARLVMEKTPHVMFAGAGANRFAREQGVPFVAPGSLVSESAKRSLEMFKKNQAEHLTETGHTKPPGPLKDVKNPGDVGTVGAVAIDINGNMAAGTSTGGLNGKMVGRVSDTSMIGSGTYCDEDVGAVSTTGHGDTIAKACLAHSIIKEMEHGKSAQDAASHCLEKMTNRLKHTAGAIVLSKEGDVGIYFTSKRMGWAYQKGNKIHSGVNHDHVVTEEV